MGKDLLLNLAAEAVGILVTVFVIDRLLKWREEKKWRPARNVIHAGMMELTERVYEAALPIGLGSRVGEIVAFLEASAFVRRQYPAVDRSEEVDWA